MKCPVCKGEMEAGKACRGCNKNLARANKKRPRAKQPGTKVTLDQMPTVFPIFPKKGGDK